MSKETNKKIMKKDMKCPVCKHKHFDISNDGKQGFCIVGCGAWFKINKDGSTKKVGYCHTEILPRGN